MTLREKIAGLIGADGPIPFSRYMEMCLYDPELGYYSRQVERFGKSGDFYTSSDVHAVFARLLARQFEEMWRVLGRPPHIEVLELGPGRGLFARDVLDWSKMKWPDFFSAMHYSLQERSGALRARLQKILGPHLSAGKASIHPDRTQQPGALAPEGPLIVFANEFFDALPVEILSSQGRLYISEMDGRFVETWRPASEELLAALDRYSVQPGPGERIEVGLVAQDHLSRIARVLRSGFIVAIDYGYTRQEQIAGRHRDTLMTYRQHSTSPNPYEAPGEQDITTHVNFTALMAAAEQAGLQLHPLRTQSQFLMGIGEATQFADAFEGCRLPQERAKVALQLKHLVTPAGMGETFHVLLASRGVPAIEVAQLRGLSFGDPSRTPALP